MESRALEQEATGLKTVTHGRSGARSSDSKVPAPKSRTDYGASTVHLVSLNLMSPHYCEKRILCGDLSLSSFLTSGAKLRCLGRQTFSCKMDVNRIQPGGRHVLITRNLSDSF